MVAMVGMYFAELLCKIECLPKHDRSMPFRYDAVLNISTQ